MAALLHRDTREQVKEQRAAAAAAKAAEEAAKEEAASARLGAGAKGYMQRKKQKKEAEEMAKASTRIQANFKGRKERHDPMSDANVRRARAANDPSYQADIYLKEHNLLELFDLLGQQLVTARPDNPRAFLIQELTRLKSLPKGVEPSSPLNVFSQEDVETLYNMYDASGLGLTRSQCLEALSAMGMEKVTVPMDVPRFDKATFLALLPAR